MVLVSCGGGSPKEASNPSNASGEGEPAKTSEAKTEAPADSGGSGSGEAKASGGEEASGGGEKKPAEEGSTSDAATLARDFLKTGGRRIGYSASKKGFAYPVEQRQEKGFGLDIQFMGEDGKPRDAMRVCQIGECEEHLDEISKELLPKLAKRLEDDGYVAIRGIGWPQGRDELEVSLLGMKLKYTKGKLEALREGKPAARLNVAGGKRLDSPGLLAVFVVPDSKVLAAFGTPADTKGGLVQDFYVFKLP
jgi:hypothetical protein